MRALVCDDSPFVCRLVSSYLEASPGIEVVGSACDPDGAIELVRRRRPNVVTLDLNMKKARGLEILDRLMHECPTPVVVISGENQNVPETARRAFEIGAVDFVSKFVCGRALDPDELRHRIVSKVRAAAQVRVVRTLATPSDRDGSRRPRSRPAADDGAAAPPLVVVVGASTGGPEALQRLLGACRRALPAAVLVVQHMPRGMTRALAHHLDHKLPWPVREARSGERVVAGTVLVAPGGHHLLLDRSLRIDLQPGSATEPYCPSVDLAMRSVARACGARARGVLLSGMGCDGSAGLAEILAAGGHTFAQEPGTCLVDSMPRCAIEIGAVESFAPPEAIGELLSRAPRRALETRHG